MTTPDVERIKAQVAWLNLDDYTADQFARAAMAATREIDAEALRGNRPVANDDIASAIREGIADWLQQRANDVKETGRG